MVGGRGKEKENYDGMVHVKRNMFDWNAKHVYGYVIERQPKADRSSLQ